MDHARFYLVLIAALGLTAILMAMSAAAVPYEPPPLGDWEVYGTKDYTGKNSTVFGSVIVKQNAQFTIKDSTLVIVDSLMVEPRGELIIENSTIRFHCNISVPNTFDAHPYSRLTIRDGDNDVTTTGDASIIESNTSENFNFTVFENATFQMSNSFLRDCGRYSPDPLVLEGLAIKTHGSSIEGCVISDGYYGIVLDQSRSTQLDNVTVSSCQVGLYMISARDTQVSKCRFVENAGYGVQVRGLQGGLSFADCEMSENGLAGLYTLYTSGYNNQVENVTLSGSAQTGMLLESTSDMTFRDVRASSCAVGIKVEGGNLDILSATVMDCLEGVVVSDSAEVRMEDLTLSNTTIDVDDTVLGNITVRSNVRWELVDANLACHIVVSSGGEMTIESCKMVFAANALGVTGLDVRSRSTINLLNSTLSGTVADGFTFEVRDGSQVEVLHVTVSNAGSATGGATRRGVYIAGTGRVENLTVSDSLAGMVVGKSLAKFVGVTIKDCETGLLLDGELGRAGIEIHDLSLRGCDVAVRGVNDGRLRVRRGSFQLAGEGFNLTGSAVELRDSHVSDPGPGDVTAFLDDSSHLHLINSSSSDVFTFGTGLNEVNIFWYLNLTLRYLSDGSPLSEAEVSVKDTFGVQEVPLKMAGVDGVLSEMELKERSFLPEERISTPHTVTVTKAALEDSFQITIDRSMDHTFLMDNHPPGLTVSFPEDGSMHNVSNLTFVGEAWDKVVTGTAGLGSLRYSIDGGNWTPIPLPEDRTWTFDASLEDGGHVVVVEVIDLVGNRNSTMLSLEVDTAPPNLVITEPEGDLITNRSRLVVRGRTDPGVEVHVDGAAVEVGGDGRFEHTYELAEGENHISVTATDDNWNQATRTILAVLDTAVPEVVLDHQGEWRTNEGLVHITGSKKPRSSLYVNGELPGFFASDRFNTSVSLVEGLNPVHIWSVDLAGNNWSTKFFIELDTTPPGLDVARLPGYTNRGQLTVQGSTDDPDAIITVNGQPINLVGLAFAHTITLSEGPNTVTVEARDDLGNEAEPDVQTVNLKTEAPDLVVFTDRVVVTYEDEHMLEGETYPGLPVAVTVTLKTYTKTYSLVAGADGGFSVEVKLPQIGNHTVRVTVEDRAGNQVTEVLNFVRERSEPPPPPPPPREDWFSENWAWVILIAAVIASAGIWLVTLSADKRRREEREVRTAAMPEAEAEETSQDEGEGTVQGERWVEEDEGVTDEGPEDDDASENEEEEPAGSKPA